MTDPTPDPTDGPDSTETEEADRRNGEPGALRSGDGAQADDGAGQLIDPDEDIDVTESTESTGEPIHQTGSDDIGAGGD